VRKVSDNGGYDAETMTLQNRGT